MKVVVFTTIVGLAIAAPAASAELTTVVIELPRVAEIIADFGFFGDGTLTGQYIVSTRIIINRYTPPSDATGLDFSLKFLVPVLSPLGGSEVLDRDGAGMGWTDGSRFDHYEETDAFNGEVRPGRFSIELDGGGTLGNGSQLEFDVSPIPTPGTLGLLAAAGVCGTPRRRRA